MDEEGIEQMITCLGAFENMEEAYGKAYLYLEDLASGHSEGYMMITTLCDLECETGYAMYARCRGKKPKYYAYILFNDNGEENGGNHDRKTGTENKITGS